MKTTSETATESPIRIFVINLKRSPERRQKMTNQLDKLQLPYEFFDGVDGALLSDDEIASVYSKSAAFERL